MYDNLAKETKDHQGSHGTALGIAMVEREATVVWLTKSGEMSEGGSKWSSFHMESGLLLG